MHGRPVTLEENILMWPFRMKMSNSEKELRLKFIKSWNFKNQIMKNYKNIYH